MDSIQVNEDPAASDVKADATTETITVHEAKPAAAGDQPAQPATAPIAPSLYGQPRK
jgi:hypothetical protein